MIQFLEATIAWATSGPCWLQWLLSTGAIGTYAVVWILFSNWWCKSK